MLSDSDPSVPAGRRIQVLGLGLAWLLNFKLDAAGPNARSRSRRRHGSHRLGPEHSGARAILPVMILRCSPQAHSRAVAAGAFNGSSVTLAPAFITWSHVVQVSRRSVGFSGSPRPGPIGPL